MRISPLTRPNAKQSNITKNDSPHFGGLLEEFMGALFQYYLPMKVVPKRKILQTFHQTSAFRRNGFRVIVLDCAVLQYVAESHHIRSMGRDGLQALLTHEPEQVVFAVL